VRTDLVLPARPQQVADHLAALDGGHAGELAPLALQLLPQVGTRRQERLELAMPRVALGEQAHGTIQVLVGEGDDLRPGHGT
jgi:hypothetical protein